MGRSVVWTAEKLEELVQEFRNGATVADMAANKHVSRIRIYQLLKQAGVTLRPRKDNVGPVTQDSIDRLDAREII